jgi:amidase
MSTLPFHSAKQLAALIRRKKIGALELLDLYLQRVQDYNGSINAIIVTQIDAARERAYRADQASAKGERWGPLHGVPMTVKEAFDLIGTPTTWGIPDYKDNYAAGNALAVQRLLDAGAVIFGKTNVPVGLSDWQTFNPIYGTTSNPWDLDRVPGGSSGGSAAALAAGLTALEIGSDIGASIRNPAHYCGVYGHKPSYAIASMQGHALPHMVDVDSLDIAVIGPMARSAADLELTLDIIAGPDAVHGAGWQLRLPKPRKKTLREYKVALVCDDAEAEVDAAVQQGLQALGQFLRDSNVDVHDGVRPAIESRLAHETYIRLLRAATASAISDEVFSRQLAQVPKLDADDDSYPARMIRAHTMYHRDWLAYNETRHRLRLAWAEFFRDYDLLLCPTATTTAFPHNQQGERWERMISVNGKPQPGTTQLFWAGYSGHVYLPSTVAPVGLSADGLPIGVQIIGPQYADHTCIHFARLLEREFYRFTPPPGYDL